jgi:hypothetical protein
MLLDVRSYLESGHTPGKVEIAKLEQKDYPGAASSVEQLYGARFGLRHFPARFFDT